MKTLIIRLFAMKDVVQGIPCLAVRPDTGPLHLANTTGISRILMLFGATPSKRKL